MIIGIKRKLFLFLNSRYNINIGIIYYLIQRNYLDEYISKIKSIKCLIVFNHNLDQFVSFFNRYFYFFNNCEKYIGIALETNYASFLFNKNNDNIMYTKFLINILKNNLKYINNNDNSFLPQYYLNIKLLNNIDIAFEFIKKLVYANLNRYELIYVFYNWEEIIKQRKKAVNKKDDLNFFYTYISNWELLLNNYKKFIKIRKKS